MFNSSEDHSSLCAFIFDDGRRCNMLQCSDGSGLCYFHSQKYDAHQKAVEAGQTLHKFLDADITTACDLNAVFNALFSATARGLVGPKTAAALVSIARLMLKTQPLAKAEYLDAFDSKNWADVVYDSPAFNTYHPLPGSASDQEIKAQVAKLARATSAKSQPATETASAAHAANIDAIPSASPIQPPQRARTADAASH
jgi:hypothetical protein